MPYTPTNFSTTAVINADTLFQNYDDEVQVLMSDVGDYLTEEMVKVYTETKTIVTDGIKVNSVETIEDLATQDGVVFKTIIVKDLNRGGTFIWSSTGTANGGTVFAGAIGFWNRQYSGAVNVKWFGAKGDASGDAMVGNDDTASIVSAIAYANSYTYPKEVFLPNGQYRISSNILLSVAHSQIRGETHRVILWCDFNGTGVSITAGGVNMYNLDVRRVSGKTGTGIEQNASPEAYFENVKLFFHTDGVVTKDSHLTTWQKCVFSNNTNYGVSDLGRCFGSEFIGCNIILNRYGISVKSDWTFNGGAIEQNTDADMFVGVSADYKTTWYGKATAIGVHFEAKSFGPTTAQILVGPSISAGASGRQGFIAKACYFIGNDSSTNAVYSRDAKLLSIESSMFIGYNQASTLIKLDATNSTVMMGGNFWDGAGTFKSINSSVTNYIDSDNTTDDTYDYNKIHIKHGSSGGELKGIQKLISAKRSSNLEIISNRNSISSSAISLKTTGADLATLFERLAFTSGTDVGFIDIPSAYLRFSGKVFSKGGTTSPISGTWAVGDIQWNTAPVAGGFIGWVCTTAGTPGTWKTFGAIS